MSLLVYIKYVIYFICSPRQYHFIQRVPGKPKVWALMEQSISLEYETYIEGPGVEENRQYMNKEVSLYCPSELRVCEYLSGKK